MSIKLKSIPWEETKETTIKKNRLIEYSLFLDKMELDYTIEGDLEDLSAKFYFKDIVKLMIVEVLDPEILIYHNRDIIRHLGEIPDLGERSDEEKLSIIRAVYNRLDDRNHPVRINTFFVDSIPELRDIWDVPIEKMELFSKRKVKVK